MDQAHAGTYINLSTCILSTSMFSCKFGFLDRISPCCLSCHLSNQVSTTMVFRSCHRALLLAVAIVLSFWISFVFGGKQVQFNDWHYDYQVLSYGLNRPEKHDDLGKIPSQFISSRGWPQRRVKVRDEMGYR